MWELYNACQLGQAKGKELADWVGTRYDEKSRAYALVVCDGAGSCVDSHLGARSLGEAFLDLFSKFCELNLEFTSKHLENVFSLAKERLSSNYASVKDLKSALSATLAGAIITQQGDIHLWQVGDGLIIAKIQQEYKLVVERDKGEYANCTLFLNTENNAANANYMVLDDECDFLLLSSDGLANIFLRQEEPQVEILSVFYDISKKAAVSQYRTFSQELIGFLSSNLVQSVCDDDLSLALAILVNRSDEI